MDAPLRSLIATSLVVVLLSHRHQRPHRAQHPAARRHRADAGRRRDRADERGRAARHSGRRRPPTRRGRWRRRAIRSAGTSRSWPRPPRASTRASTEIGRTSHETAGVATDAADTSESTSADRRPAAGERPQHRHGHQDHQVAGAADESAGAQRGHRGGARRRRRRGLRGGGRRGQDAGRFDGVRHRRHLDGRRSHSDATPKPPCRPSPTSAP